MAEVMDLSNDKDTFPLGVDTSMGPSSWYWPEDVPSKHKLASFKEFGPEEVFFECGAHTP